MIDLEAYISRQLAWRGQRIVYARLLNVTVSRIVDTNGALVSDSLDLDAYNQQLYLVFDDQLPDRLRITSDTGVLYTGSMATGQFMSFSGKVSLQLPEDFKEESCAVQFYQVLTEDT